MPGDAQILKACSEETDSRDISVERVLGDHLTYDAIGGNDIEHVQPFNGCCRQCCQLCPGFVLRLPATCV